MLSTNNCIINNLINNVCYSACAPLCDIDFYLDYRKAHKMFIRNETGM